MYLELVSHVPETPKYETPILFLHGAWHGAWCWEEHYLPYFAQQGFTAHAMSLRGHGTSEGRKQLRSTTVGDYVTDLLTVVKSLPAPPVIVGHSLGGFITQKYLEHYDAPAVVLFAPAPAAGGWKFSLRMWWRAPLDMLKSGATLTTYPLIGTLERTRRAFFSPDLPREQVEHYFQQMQDKFFRAYLDYLVLALPDTRSIRERGTPMLILGAANDTIFPRRELEALGGVYNANVVIVPNIAHDMMLETRWQTAADHLIAWLKDQEVS